jgi:hypothetical protein
LSIALNASPVSTGTTEYAPYFYAWGWGNSAYSFSSLVDMQKKAGTKGATLAFVLGSSGCKASRDIQDNIADVNAFRAAGGMVKATRSAATPRHTCARGRQTEVIMRESPTSIRESGRTVGAPEGRVHSARCEGPRPGTAKGSGMVPSVNLIRESHVKANDRQHRHRTEHQAPSTMHYSSHPTAA